VLGHDDLAEEATATTLVRASRAEERSQAARDDDGWIATIAAQAVADIQRRERRHSMVPVAGPTVDDRPVEPPDLETIATIGATWQLRRAIGRLPSTDATVVRLQHLHALTSAQIAAGLGLPVATVVSISRRAHRQLVSAWRTSSDVGSIDAVR
jgi:DNA-directed RNA polymerase specialized sigma24 family protein